MSFGLNLVIVLLTIMKKKTTVVKTEPIILRQLITRANVVPGSHISGTTVGFLVINKIIPMLICVLDTFHEKIITKPILFTGNNHVLIVL